MSALRGFLAFLVVAILLPNGQVLATDPAKSSENRPTRKLEWIGLLQRGEYNTLTKHLEKLQELHEKGEISWRPVRTAFKAFKYTDPALLKMLDAWVERHPRSFAAYTARGTYLANLGYVSRGVNSSARTTNEAFAAMGNFYSGAFKDLMLATKMNRRALIPYIELTVAYMFTGSHVAVDNLYQKAKDLVPDASLLHEKYLYTLHPKWRGGRTKNEYMAHYEALRKFAAKVIDKSNSDPSYHLAAQLVHYLFLNQETLRGNYQVAIEGYTKLLENGGSPYLKLERGSAYYYSKQYKYALKDAVSLLNNDPDYGRAYRLAARTLKAQERYKESESFYRKALKLDPFHPDLLIELAGVVWKGERWVEVEKITENALAFGGWNPELHAIRGRLYNNMRLFSEAKNSYKSALKLTPGDAQIMTEYVATLTYDKDCDVFNELQNLLELCASGKQCKATRLEVIEYNIKGRKMEEYCGRKAPWKKEKAPLDRAF